MGPDKNALHALKIDRSEERRSGRWKWLLVAAVVAVVVVVLVWLASREETPVVRTAEARELSVGATSTVLNASGYVTARRKATVSSKVTAKVVEVLIEEGMVVTEGQVLARLDAANVEVSLNLVEAELIAARALLAETAVRIREAELDLERVVSLVGEGVASKADLDRVQAEVDSLRARLDSQHQQVKVAGRQVAVWQQQLADTVIRAPFAGVVISKDAQPGEMISPVSAGGGYTRTGIGTVVDMSSLEIEVDVNESYINRVSAGQPAAATLDAYPDWQIPARVIAIVPTADRQKATVRVRIGFEVLDARILPDMGVKVAFQEITDGQPVKAVLTVPAAAVRSDGGRQVVLVVNGSKVERRAISARVVEGESAIVEAGLAAGELVVVEGPDDLSDGDRVEVQQ